MMPPELTFILVTHQSERLLGECLAAVRDVWPSPCIVVDNASGDASVKMAGQAGAVVLLQKENLGFARAANLGAQKARTEWICFLNPDVSVTNELREAFERAVASGSSGRLLVPDYLEKNGVVVQGRQPGYSPWKIWADLLESQRRGPALVRWCRRRSGYHDPSWHWPLAACLFAPRSLFLQRGGFDESYFLYMEDVELGWRWSRVGGEVLRLDVTVSHRGQEGAKVEPSWRKKQLDAARRQFGQRHYGLLWNAVMNWSTR